MSAKKRGKSAAGDDPHHSREQSRYDSPIASREFITSLLKAEKGPMDFEALADRLSLTGDADGMEALRRRVGAMLRDGQLIQNRKRGLVPVDTEALIAGRISAHPDGFGFVIADDGDKDVYLNGKQMRQVLHGDRVVVCVTGIDHRGRREGRIVDVVERANKSLVGRLSIDRGTVVVLPDNKRIHQDLLIAPGELADAADGDMVVAEIIEQPTRRHQPVGRVIEVLGQHLRPGMEIDVALHSHGIPTEWPADVMEQAAAFSPTVPQRAAKGRRDVRELSLITIDGADARDFDDAVWCERLEKGWRLIVAIADVAHYVLPATPLDREAVERGTSVYFPGRVVPMLPEVLSNGLCSLNPQVDRLCMLCELTLDGNASVKKTRFHNGIMASHARLTYDQVSEMLTQRDSPLRGTHKTLVPMIEELHRLYKALATKRRARGAIEFDSNETHIVFDENKKIREIVPIERNDAHKLIEECMILANIEAAAYLEEHEIPTLYRVHAGPKADRLEDLRAFLALRDLTLGGGDAPTAQDYAALAETISERPDRSVIQTVMLRSMQQAVYQPKNEGHFGLALHQYAHFTSPIRRYPDLLVHRALKHVLAGARSTDYRYSKEAMQVLGESCSMTERRAEEASRDVVSWLKCEYMQEHVGSEFPGVISAVTSFGLFVELTGIHVEGLIHITNLSHDYYRFEQAAHALTGERTGKQYHLGDSIVVQVAAVNLEERKIDFIEVAHQTSKGKQGRSRGTGKRDQQQKEQVRTDPSAASSQPALPTVQGVEKVVSAEQRRQEKRRRKQQRRDDKRTATREAKNAHAEKGAGTQTPASKESPPDKAKKTAAVTPRSAGKKTSSRSAVRIKAESAAVAKTASHAGADRKVVAKSEASGKAAAKTGASTKVSSKSGPSSKVASTSGSSGKVASKSRSMSKVGSKSGSSGKVASKPRSSSKAASKSGSSRKAASTSGTSRKVATKFSAASHAAAISTSSSRATAKSQSARKTEASSSTAGRDTPASKAASKVSATTHKVDAKRAKTVEASARSKTVKTGVTRRKSSTGKTAAVAKKRGSSTQRNDRKSD